MVYRIFVEKKKELAHEAAGLYSELKNLLGIKNLCGVRVLNRYDADDIDADSFDNGIDDDTFAKIVACIRISVPYTGMIVSTRESKACREKVLHLGVSQISGGSRTSVGGYVEPEEDDHKSEQFDVEDKRTLDEVVKWLMEMDYIPSFCTACYREGRTGDRFMSLCKTGQIQNCCLPNALMTLQEYLEDYASAETKEVGEKLIQKDLQTIPNEKVKQLVIDNLENIKNGKRDFRFLRKYALQMECIFNFFSKKY